MLQSKWRLTGLAIAAALLAPQNSPAQAATLSTDQQEAVRALASSKPLKSFYAARDYRPIWFSDRKPTALALQLVGLLESASLDGLNAHDYRPERLREALQATQLGDQRDLARAEIALSRALVEYAHDLHRNAAFDMEYVDKELRPSQPDVSTLLEAVAADGPIDRVVQMHPLYMQLRAGYELWRKDWADAPDVLIPSGAALTSGSKGDRVRLLRNRLGLSAGTGFDAAVANKLRSFKEAHGLPANAIVDAQTLAVLNQPRGSIDSRIRLNLARARQLPPPAAGRHIVVDAAGQRLYLYDGDRVLDTMKVVVGKPSEPTPMIAALIRYTAINPYWYVPPDLISSRIAQNVLTEGLGYLQTKRYEIWSDWSANARRLDPTTVDWQAVADGRLQLAARQEPGPGNMMGAMKFMFPNRFGVYLHDTPEKGLFGEIDRRRSSGCVRLEDAPRLARWLYGKVPTAPQGTGEYNVPLPNPVPVYITYFTVAPTSSGIAFRDDVYGRDKISGSRLASAF